MPKRKVEVYVDSQNRLWCHPILGGSKAFRIPRSWLPKMKRFNKKRFFIEFLPIEEEKKEKK
jgi:hypothetical protein